MTSRKPSALQTQCETTGLPFKEVFLEGSGRAAEIALPTLQAKGWRGMYGRGSISWAIVRALTLPALRKYNTEPSFPSAMYSVALPAFFDLLLGRRWSTLQPLASEFEIADAMRTAVRDRHASNSLALTNDFRIICEHYRATGYSRIPDGISISEIIDCTSAEAWVGLLETAIFPTSRLTPFPQIEITNGDEYRFVVVTSSGAKLKSAAIATHLRLVAMGFPVHVLRVHLEPSSKPVRHQNNVIIDI